MKKVGVILARFQPIHNGHLELIKKAISENEEVVIFIGSADKMNMRNPIPYNMRKDLVYNALTETFGQEILEKVRVYGLDDLTDETDNTHDWGFYLYSKVVSITQNSNFTIYYSDGFEIITSWFPGFLLRNNVSLSLLARNSVEDGVSATKVRNLITIGLEGDNFKPCEEELEKILPPCVFEKRYQIKAYLEVFNRNCYEGSSSLSSSIKH